MDNQNELKSEAAPGHNWDIRSCMWCGKPHVKYPVACAKGIAKQVKRFGKKRPAWVQQLINDANAYLDSFRIHRF